MNIIGTIIGVYIGIISGLADRGICGDYRGIRR